MYVAWVLYYSENRIYIVTLKLFLFGSFKKKKKTFYVVARRNRTLVQHGARKQKAHRKSDLRLAASALQPPKFFFVNH